MQDGAENLIVGCVGAREGQTILLVTSDGYDGYDAAVADIVAGAATGLGCRAFVMRAPPIADPGSFHATVGGAMGHVDHTIFFNRIGDQVRFCATPGRGTKTMTYALTPEFLGSPFCTLPHGLMVDVLAALNRRIAKGGRWRVTCPLGTDIAGDAPPFVPSAGADGFTVNLFPLGVFRPVTAATMSGRIVTRWLCPTLNRASDTDGFAFDRPVILEVESGRIVGYGGDADAALRTRAQYERTAARFGIDGSIVHSWHAGIHPKTWYDRPAADSMTRWGTVAFSSPRYTHFHTCGDYAPGEISPVVIDATIRLDDEVLWNNGAFVLLDQPDMTMLRDGHDAGPDGFVMRTDIGV